MKRDVKDGDIWHPYNPGNASPYSYIVEVTFTFSRKRVFECWQLGVEHCRIQPQRIDMFIGLPVGVPLQSFAEDGRNKIPIPRFGYCALEEL